MRIWNFVLVHYVFAPRKQIKDVLLGTLQNPSEMISILMAIAVVVPADPTQRRIANLIRTMNITEKLGMMEGTSG